MKKLGKLILFLIFFGLILPGYLTSVEAASLNFDKTTVSAANGSTFQIAVTVDPGSDSLNSTDVYVTFDSTLLKATSVVPASLFPIVQNDLSTSGKVYIAGMVSDSANAISTAGTLATITFQGLKDGTGTLAFDCSSSKIVKNDANMTNVITCSSNGTSAVTIGSGSSAAAPTQAQAPGQQLPRSGIFDNFLKLAIPGMILLLLGSVFRLFI